MTVTMEEAQERLKELATLADGGEKITIMRADLLAIRLTSEPQQPKRMQKRHLGQNLLGVKSIDPDWDQPLTDQEAEEWGF